MFRDEVEKQYVIEFLTRQISGQGDARAAIVQPLPVQFQERIGSGLPRQLVVEVIRVCVEDGWNNTPSLLYSVLYFYYAAADAKIREIIERIKTRPADSPDPLGQTILIDGTPFINRKDFRSHLIRLTTPAAELKPILMVSSAAKKVGKSYSSKFIDHFANVRRTIVPCTIEFKPELAVDLKAESLARKMVFLITGKIPANIPQYTNNVRIVDKLAEWVISEAFNTNYDQVWFVLDNFRGENLTQDTRDFINALSEQMTTGVIARKCKLILIAFDRNFLKVDDGKIGEDKVHKCKKEEVIAVMEEIKKAAPVILDDDWLTNFVFQNLPDDESKMLVLNLRLRHLIYAVIELKRILEQRPEIGFETVLYSMLDNLPAGDEKMVTLKERLDVLEESLQEIDNN